MPLSARLWTAAATIAAPALRLMLRRRSARGRELPGRLAERHGQSSTPRPTGRLLWLHAASVGESLSVLKLVGALPPDISVLFTTGTVTRRPSAAGAAGGKWHTTPASIAR